MNTAKALVVAALIGAAATMQAAAGTPWRAQVDSLIDCGEFAQARALMKKLPSKERRSQAVTIDSLTQIMQRISADFSMTPQEGARLIREKYPQTTDAQIEAWKQSRALEVMRIDGQERWFRKSVRNLWLLGQEFAAGNAIDRGNEAEGLLTKFRQAMQHPADTAGVRDWRHVEITFTLDVQADAVPAGETLRVWMPIAMQNLRQRHVQLLSSNRPATLSQGSKHHTVYMEGVAQKGQPTHFEYRFAYDVGERHVAREDLVAMAVPYKVTPDYIKYTSSEGPHIQVTDSMRELAIDIVGDPDENPVVAAGMIYRWIAERFPWAGAREYSTIRNMPQYVLKNGHGDCGQVTLLYITLCRALGIPARWESGYQIPPGDVNYHDWAETYFEGVGWVPTDQSYGRSTLGTVLASYYCSGLDLYRMASNEGIGDRLDPPKKFIRSETVDFQPGEVEWQGGNLYYDKWKSHLQVDSISQAKTGF